MQPIYIPTSAPRRAAYHILCLDTMSLRPSRFLRVNSDIRIKHISSRNSSISKKINRVTAILNGSLEFAWMKSVAKYWMKDEIELLGSNSISHPSDPPTIDAIAAKRALAHDQVTTSTVLTSVLLRWNNPMSDPRICPMIDPMTNPTAVPSHGNGIGIIEKKGNKLDNMAPTAAPISPHNNPPETPPARARYKDRGHTFASQSGCICSM